MGSDNINDIIELLKNSKSEGKEWLNVDDIHKLMNSMGKPIRLTNLYRKIKKNPYYFAWRDRCGRKEYRVATKRDREKCRSHRICNSREQGTSVEGRGRRKKGKTYIRQGCKQVHGKMGAMPEMWASPFGD